MSCWTYVFGVIEVSPIGVSAPQKKYVLETVLAHLPQVTGSEGDMEVYLLEQRGHDTSCSHDEFGQWKRDLVRYNTSFTLVVQARLRDRYFEQTKREFVKWLARLAKRVDINEISVKVWGRRANYDLVQMVILDAEPYQQMFEGPSWYKDGDGEINWTEFMLWDCAKDSEYPMLLAYKYYNDPENDAEVERRRAWREQSWS